MANFRQPPNAGGPEAVIISKNITANGTYNASSDNADGYDPVTVAVPEKVIVSKNITANGTYNASSDSADGYNPVTVNVPGPTIVSKNITANGTYNASSDSADGYNPVTVDIHVPATITGSGAPNNSQGVNGDTYIKVDDTAILRFAIKALGGYNGGAHIICSCDDIEFLHAIGTVPYNLDYDVKTGSVSKFGKTIRVSITPPTFSTSDLIVTWFIDDVSVWVNNISPNGTNTSYGYDSILTHNENITMDNDYILGMWYKQNGVWLSNNDIIDI